MQQKERDHKKEWKKGNVTMVFKGVFTRGHDIFYVGICNDGV